MGGINSYAYTHNRPTNLRDPSGEIAPAIVAVALCAEGAAIGGYAYHTLSGRKTTFGGYVGSMAAGCAAGIFGGWAIGIALEAMVPGIALAGGEAVLWSGGGQAGANAAAAYASQTAGAAVIGETFAGSTLNLATSLGVSYSVTQPLWAYFSGMFAAGAGSATVFLGPRVSQASIYVTRELPALLNNGVIPWIVWVP